MSQDNTIIVSVLLTFLGVVLLGTLLLVLWVVWWVRRIDLPAGADFVDALRATPLVVVVMLDLLDLSLDILSAPVAWFLLDRLGLAPLRGVAVVKGLIPMTSIIPLMTISWFVVRLFERDRRLAFRQRLHLPR